VKYYSEYGQDLWLAEGVFRGKRDGVFVEMGALDGIFHSNTLHFEREMGWDGLLIEPHPLLWPRLVASERSCQKMQAAISDKTAWTDFVMSGVPGWSGLYEFFEPEHRTRLDQAMSKLTQVPTVTLAQALVAADLVHIDYLSVDVEGAELPILSVFPFEDFDVDVFGIENNFGNEAIARLMVSNGYAKIGRVGVDDFYRRLPMK
jgi:FkbM family methyltransferase